MGKYETITCISYFSGPFVHIFVSNGLLSQKFCLNLQTIRCIMNMSVEVTIGIPVYNAEGFIERCLLSTLNQTFLNIEILLVDDCGKDHSMEVAERIAKSHPRGECVRIVRHEHNMGVAHARNTIIREARGKYLYLMDSDDEISKDAIAILYEKAEQYDAETVWGSYLTYEGNPQMAHPKQYPDMLLLGEDKLVEYECQNMGECLQMSIWNILFRLDFVRSLGFGFEQHGSLDDLIFQHRMQPKVKRAVLISDITYFYYKRDNSISNFQYRTTFKRSEAVNAMEAVSCLKDSCVSLASKSYSDRRCTKVMRLCFFFCYGILRHRKLMDQPVKNREIQEMMKHPFPLGRIMQFKEYRNINLFFYFLASLPPFLMVSLFKFITKIRGFN